MILTTLFTTLQLTSLLHGSDTGGQHEAQRFH